MNNNGQGQPPAFGSGAASGNNTGFGSGSGTGSAFSFGAPSAYSGTKATTGGFGTGSTAPGSTFSFGASNSGTGAPSFGTSSAGASQSTPAFSFGNSNASSGKSSGFSFGQKPAGEAPKPAFSLGQPATQTNKTSQDGQGSTAPKPLFGGLGSTPSTVTTSAQPATAGSSLTAKTGFSFGNSGNSTPASGTAENVMPTQKPAFSFGGQSSTTTAASDKPTSLLGAAKPAEAPKLSFNFGAGASGDAGAAKSEASKPSFSFGAAPTGSSVSSSTTPAPALNFGAKPATTTATEPTKLSLSFGAKPASESSEKPAFSFATTSTAEKPAATATATATKPDTAATKPAFSFGVKPAEGSSTASVTAPAAAADTKIASESKAADKPVLTTGGKAQGEKDDKGLANSTTTTNTASTGSTTKANDKPADLSPSEYLKNKSFEDILGRWTGALSSDLERFHAQADEATRWDRILVVNGEKIAEIWSEVAAAEAGQQRIDDVLGYVSRQQDDVERMLDQYERQIGGGSGSSAGAALDNLQPIDQERMAAYGLAEQVNDKLESLETNLKSVITEINDVSQGTNHAGTDDPVSQVVQVLNAHLASLQYVDEAAQRLQEKVANAYTKSARLSL